MFWNSDSTVTLKSFSNNHIDAMVMNELLGEREWRFTGFYGEPVRSRTKHSWELMQYLHREYDNPWICAGGFNEILSTDEHFGRNNREEWQMEGFRNVVDECRFGDLGYSSLPYTWDNRQQGEDNVKVRLDRALGDDRFQEIFDNTTVKHVQTIESDHCALLITIQKSVWFSHSRRGKPF